MKNKCMKRRDFIKSGIKTASLMNLAYLSACGLDKPNALNKGLAKLKRRAISKNIALVSGQDVGKVTERAIDLLGGIKHYISRGDIVIIKPNIGWARLPEQAATTNPMVIRKVIELCHNAGAAKVSVTDLPCNSADITFQRTGIKKAVESVDGYIYYPSPYRIKNMKLLAPFYLPIDKKEIKNWPMFLDFIEADKLINIPIAKHHKLSKLTLGMKNWYGAIAGRRNQLHQAIHQSIASFAYHFKPHLTIIDGIRILLRNGPTGGSIQDTSIKNTIIAGSNPVACDAIAALKLFGKSSEEVPYIHLAYELGLGHYKSSEINLKTDAV